MNIISVLVILFLNEVTAVLPSCDTLPSDNAIESTLQSLLVSEGGSNPNIDLLTVMYTCMAQGMTMGSYREVSVIVTYDNVINPQPRQFVLECVSVGDFSGWQGIGGSLDFAPTGFESLETRTNCSQCRVIADNDHDCVGCHPDCNFGLMRCTDSGSDSCCPLFDNGQCAEYCSQVNNVANEQNNYRCSCGLTCGSGYILNSTECICNLIDVCLAETPCDNNGICILGSQPDEYTCNCTNTGYIGIKCTVIVSVVTDGCATETDSDYGIQWPATSPNTTVQQDCGGPDVVGLATRYCSKNGEWLTVNASSCQSRIFQEINATATVIFSEELGNLNSTELEDLSLEAMELVDELAIATQDTDGTEQSLFPSELALTNNILFETLQIHNASFIANGRSIVDTNSIADTQSNVLDTRNRPGWNSVQNDNPTMGPEMLLNNAEDFGLFLATSLDDTTEVTLARENIVITARLITAALDGRFEDITFPTPSTLDIISSQELSNDSIVIPSELIEERVSERVTLPVSNILFNTIQEFLQATNIDGGIIPATRVISSQVGTQRGTINYTNILQDSTINISLGIQIENFTDPSCVFWQFSTPIGTGFWSNEGITTFSVDAFDTVICLSNHLTSFAVLVDITGSTINLSKEERTALSIVSYILVVISVVCLILTIIFFLSFGKELFKSVHYFVHLNLALSILLAFIVFLFGIETAVHNKVACTIVAALLHYFFLSAFCWKLCEGVMLYLMLVVVFSTLSKKWWFFLLLGWIPPFIPVIVTVAVTIDYYTDAEFFCWLSSDRNVIWGFVVPVIIIIIINTIFLVFVIITLVKNRGSRNAHMLEANKRVDLVVTTVKASVILLPLLGLTWLFGLLSFNRQTSFFAWVFVILNASQGTAIFILHVIRHERIWNRIVKTYHKLTSKSGEYSTTSQISGKFLKKRKYLYYKDKDNTQSTSGGVFHDKEKFELAPIATIHEKAVSDVDEKSMDFESINEEPDIEKPLGDNEYVEVGPVISTSSETQDQVPPEQSITQSEFKRSIVKTTDDLTHSMT